MLQSPLLKKLSFIDHAFFSRRNGFSKKEYFSLNASYNVKDDHVDVTKNLTYIASQLGESIENLYYLKKQIHSTDIIQFTNDSTKPNNKEADGIITQLPNKIISVVTADCMPILFVNTKNKSVAAVHSGWKGLLNGIIENTINLLQNPEDTFVAIGPCIHKQSYEVNEPFFNEFIKIDPEYKRFFEKKQNNHYMFDFNNLAYYKLLKNNIPPNNIDIIPHDTYSNEDLFFSHRRTTHRNETTRGLQMSCIKIK